MREQKEKLLNEVKHFDSGPIVFIIIFSQFRCLVKKVVCDIYFFTCGENEKCVETLLNAKIKIYFS